MFTYSEPGFYRCDAGCGRKTQHRAADGQTPACRGKCTAAVNAALASKPFKSSRSPEPNTGGAQQHSRHQKEIPTMKASKLSQQSLPSPSWGCYGPGAEGPEGPQGLDRCHGERRAQRATAGAPGVATLAPDLSITPSLAIAYAPSTPTNQVLTYELRHPRHSLRGCRWQRPL